MHVTRSRAAVAAVASLLLSGVVGCAGGGGDYPASPVNTILTDREAVRLAELHLDEIDPNAGPRDVVTVEPTHEGNGQVVGFQTFFDESRQAPKVWRLVMVEHDGDVKEIRYAD